MWTFFRWYHIPVRNRSLVPLCRLLISTVCCVYSSFIANNAILCFRVRIACSPSASTWRGCPSRPAPTRSNGSWRPSAIRHSSLRSVGYLTSSIADPGCLSRILIFTHLGSRIPDLGSRISDPGSRIPDPGSKNSNKRERWKKIRCQTFLCSHKI